MSAEKRPNSGEYWAILAGNFSTRCRDRQRDFAIGG
jgi:hypothetical protein